MLITHDKHTFVQIVGAKKAALLYLFALIPCLPKSQPKMYKPDKNKTKKCQAFIFILVHIDMFIKTSLYLPFCLEMCSSHFEIMGASNI